MAAGAASAAGATGEGVEPAAKRARGAAERAAGAEAPAEGAEGPTVSGSLPDSVAALFDATFQKLSKGRKKVGKSLPPTLAPPAAVATYGGAGGVSTSKVVGLGKAKVTAAELLPPDVAAACGAAAAAGGGDGGGAAEEAGAAAIVVGASDGTLRLTDARKGSVLRKFAGAGSGHSASICAVSCGAGVGGAPSVVSGDSNGVVKLWSLGGGGDDAGARRTLPQRESPPCGARPSCLLPPPYSDLSVRQLRPRQPRPRKAAAHAPQPQVAPSAPPRLHRPSFCARALPCALHRASAARAAQPRNARTRGRSTRRPRLPSRCTRREATLSPPRPTARSACSTSSAAGRRSAPPRTPARAPPCAALRSTLTAL